MHSLHMSDKISSEIAFESAAFFLAGVLIAIVNTSMLCELISSVELLLADIAIERFALFDAEMCCLVLLKQEIKVKLLRAIVAMPFLVL